MQSQYTSDTHNANERKHGFERVAEIIENGVYAIRLLRAAIDDEVKADSSYLARGAERALHGGDTETKSLAAVLLCFLAQEYPACPVDPSFRQRATDYIRSSLITKEDTAVPSLALIVTLGLDSHPWANEISRWVEQEETAAGELALVVLARCKQLDAALENRIVWLIRDNAAFVTLAVDSLMQAGLRHPNVWDAMMNKLKYGDSWNRLSILNSLVHITENQRSAQLAVQRVVDDRTESADIRSIARQVLALINTRLEHSHVPPSVDVPQTTASIGNQYMAQLKSRAWLAGAVLYFIFPLDFDFIPLIGWIDDVIVAYICIQQSKACKAA